MVLWYQYGYAVDISYVFRDEDAKLPTYIGDLRPLGGDLESFQTRLRRRREAVDHCSVPLLQGSQNH
jgi:hypothetical protein